MRCPHFRHEMVIHYDGVNSIMKIIPARNTQHRLFPRICVIHDLPFVFLFHTYCNCTLCHTCCTSGYISVLAVAHNLLSPLLVDAALTVGLLGIQGLYWWCQMCSVCTRDEASDTFCSILSGGKPASLRSDTRNCI